jgi:hypothetical protein
VLREDLCADNRIERRAPNLIVDGKALNRTPMASSSAAGCRTKMSPATCAHAACLELEHAQ